MSRQAPYSHQHVHCAHCDPCSIPDCLKSEFSRRKCRSAMRRDDLKKHTLAQHPGKSPMAVGDRKQRNMREFYTKNTGCSESSCDESPSEPLSLNASETFDGGECLGSSNPPSCSQIPNTVNTEEPTSVSHSFIQKIGERFDSLEDTLSTIMKNIKISYSDSTEANSSKYSTDIQDVDCKMLPCRSIKYIETFFPFPQVFTRKYETLNGIDSSNAKQLPQVFRSLKQTLKEHVRDTDMHRKAPVYIEKQ